MAVWDRWGRGSPNPFRDNWVSGRLSDASNFVTNDYPGMLQDNLDFVRDDIPNALRNVASGAGATPGSGSEYQQSQVSANAEAELYGALQGSIGNRTVPYTGRYFAMPNADQARAAELTRSFYAGSGSGQPQQQYQSGPPAPRQQYQAGGPGWAGLNRNADTIGQNSPAPQFNAQALLGMGAAGLQQGFNYRSGVGELGNQMSPYAGAALSGIMQQRPTGYQAPNINFNPDFAGSLPGTASPSAPGYGGPALFQPQTPSIGFQPQTPRVGFRAQTPRVNFRAQAPNMRFQPRTPQVGFQPQTPQVGFQPQTPRVNFQAQAPQIGFQPQTPQIGFQPQTPEVGFQAQTPNIGFTPQTPEVGFQAQTPQIGFTPQTPEVGFQAQTPQINLSERADPTRSLQNMMSPGGTNPYLDNIIGSAARTAGRSFRENILPSIADRAIASGNFGGSRPEIAKGIAARGLGEKLADMSSQLYGQDYQQSMNRALQASGISAGLQQSADQAATEQARLGMQGQQMGSAAAIEQARLGMQTQQLGGQLATEQARLGMQGQQLGSSTAVEQARLGMQTQQLAGQLSSEQAKLGLGAQQLGGQLATEQAQIGRAHV